MYSLFLEKRVKVWKLENGHKEREMSKRVSQVLVLSGPSTLMTERRNLTMRMMEKRMRLRETKNQVAVGIPKLGISSLEE
jgi:hypothetical protein